MVKKLRSGPASVIVPGNGQGGLTPGLRALLVQKRAIQLASFACLAASAAAGPASAADPVRTPVRFDDPLIVSIGATSGVGSAFDGAIRYSPFGLPSLSWRHASEPVRFSAPDDSLNVTVYRQGSFSFGPTALFRGGRYYRDQGNLYGLRKVDWTVEAGAFIEYWPIEDALRTRVEVRQGFNGHHGVVADFSADYVFRAWGVRFSAGPRLTLASGPYMRTNFGISPAEAALNGRITPFNPSGGLKSVGALVSASYDWTPRLNSLLFARYERLVGDAANSDIVSVLGRRNGVTVGLTTTYSFPVNW